MPVLLMDTGIYSCSPDSPKPSYLHVPSFHSQNEFHLNSKHLLSARVSIQSLGICFLLFLVGVRRSSHGIFNLAFCTLPSEVIWLWKELMKKLFYAICHKFSRLCKSPIYKMKPHHCFLSDLCDT